jgi:DNA-binding GntR family transcriptional regulator
MIDMETKNNKFAMKSLQAYEILRDMILQGQKLPGTRLILFDLEKELNIGRGPIREALIRLGRTGLVQYIPYKGAVVAIPPTQKEIFHIYDLRIDLEVKLGVEAMDHLANGDIMELEKLHDIMQGSPMDHHHYDSSFHFVIYNASNLPHLCAVARSLRDSVESVLNIYRRDREHCLRFNREHGLIIEAIKEKDLDKLKTTLATNIESGLEIIKETYANIVKIHH